MEIEGSKSFGAKIWEFVLSVGGILGILSLLGAKVTQGIVYAVISGGIVLITINHVISFFQEIDKNIKYIKDKLNGGKNGGKERGN